MVRCITIPTTVVANASLVPVVKAVWGKTVTPLEQVVYHPAMVGQVTYTCKGTTLDYSCKQGPPPPTVGDIAKNIGEFVLGFADGLAVELGFAKCIANVNATYSNTKTAIDFFEKGFNKITPESMMEAFKVIGTVLVDLGKAIVDCYHSSENLVNQLEGIAATLSAGPAAILEVVVSEGVHVWHDRKEITQDCKALVSDWRAGDYMGSGQALGSIVGELVNGLQYDMVVV